MHGDVVGTCSTRDAKWPGVALKLVGACFSDFSGALVLWLSLLRPHPLVTRNIVYNIAGASVLVTIFQKI